MQSIILRRKMVMANLGTTTHNTHDINNDEPPLVETLEGAVQRSETSEVKILIRSPNHQNY